MPWPILPDTNVAPESKQERKEPSKEVWHSATGSAKETWWDKLILLVATWQYFKYTGLAISKGHKVPPSWMRFTKTLGQGRLQKAMQKHFEVKKEVKYKVVDIEKGTPIPLTGRIGVPDLS
jgi:hypothetical protein